jgi:hypothetical protein
MMFSDWPLWGQYLAQGLLMFGLMSFSAVILSRAGRSPYWAIFTVMPYFIVAAVWVLALTSWPRLDKR